MSQIYRYELNTWDQMEAPVGRVTRVEHAEGFGGQRVEFWLAAEDTAPQASYSVVGTGHTIPDDMVVMGSTDRQHGLVWHLVRPWLESDDVRSKS